MLVWSRVLDIEYLHFYSYLFYKLYKLKHTQQKQIFNLHFNLGKFLEKIKFSNHITNFYLDLECWMKPHRILFSKLLS